MIFLDTHVIVWLYANTINKIPSSVQKLLDDNELLISAAVEFEIELLYEIGRIKIPANVIIQDLHAHLGMTISDISFYRIIEEAKTIKWTRDPFDRMIVANASIFQLPLITKDEIIRENYSLAQWG